MILWLAGLAPGLGRLASISNTTFLSGVEQTVADSQLPFEPAIESRAGSGPSRPDKDCTGQRDRGSYEQAEAGPLWLALQGSRNPSGPQGAQERPRGSPSLPQTRQAQWGPCLRGNSPGLAPKPRKEATARGGQERGFWGPCN